MGKAKRSSQRAAKGPAANAPAAADFDVVLGLIDAARTRAYQAVNTALIDLYRAIGEQFSGRVASAGWGQGTVNALAEYIRRRQPNARGFSAQNLWRMKQFFEAYRGFPKLSALLRELPWTHNLMILGKCKRDEEREFYLRLAQSQKWTSRDLERQINGALFERTVLSPPKLAPALRELHPDAAAIFKDTYLLDFLDLPPGHSEGDLQKARVEQLRRFLIELGRDFCFVGSQYQLQVGKRDFYVNLLFFNRALRCLVAFELKVEEFQPEHIGQLQFYLEALDRDVRKPHEGPTIGVLLCATKDSEVVEYALSRTVSPALVADYEPHLPDKNLLRAKLHEYYELARGTSETPAIEGPKPRAAKPKRKKRAGK
jgi:predicted nuclease of restriction endonuclease-like (RecB) superfamily